MFDDGALLGRGVELTHVLVSFQARPHAHPSTRSARRAHQSRHPHVRRFSARAGAAALIIAAALAAFAASPPRATPPNPPTASASPSPLPSGATPTPELPQPLGTELPSADQIMINAEKATRLHLK